MIDASNLNARRKNCSPVWMYFKLDLESKEATCAQPECGHIVKNLNTGNAEQHLSNNHKEASLELLKMKEARKSKNDSVSRHEHDLKQPTLLMASCKDYSKGDSNGRYKGCLVYWKIIVAEHVITLQI